MREIAFRCAKRHSKHRLRSTETRGAYVPPTNPHPPLSRGASLQQQKRQALKKKDEVSDRRGARVVTDVLPQSKWYDAEEYHQKYLMKQRR